MDPQITESLTETETENRESLERQEFANRLANQNSALVSLGNVQAGMAQETGSPKAQTGTLEGLEEIREVIAEKLKSNSETTKDDVSEVSKSESIFSDASKSDEEKSILSTSAFSTSSKSSAKSNDVEKSTTKSYTENFEESVVSENPVSETEIESEAKSELLFANQLEPAAQVPEKVADNSDHQSDEHERKVPLKSPDVVEEHEDSAKVENLAENAEETDAKIELVGTNTNDRLLDQIFEQNSVTPKITLDDFDIPQAELSQTKEISVADSSLVEMLNLYEDAKNQRSLDLEDFVPAEPEESLRLNVTLPQNKPRKKSPPKKHDCKSKTLEVQKKNLSKRTDWSHVKSSGYGTKTITKSGKTGERTGRPRISPRITAKVEEAKKERMKSVAEKKKSVEPENSLEKLV